MTGIVVAMWTIEHNGPVRVVRRSDALPETDPGQTWAQLESMVVQALRQRWVIDVGSQRLLTSEALAVMVGMVRQVQDAGGRIVFANCSPGVVNILNSMRLVKLVQLHPDVASAVTELSA
jgi:anti-anti-sigma regulatory factor